jgi:hypothetical protein
MKNLLLAILLAAVAGNLAAQPASHGVLRISGHVEGSLIVVFAPQSAPAVETSGASTASFSVTTIGGSFSHRPAAVAPGETSFLVSEPFSITVRKANLLSATYTLKAALAVPDPQHAWKVDNTLLTGAQMRTLAAAEPYGIPAAHNLTVSGPAGAMNFVNAINFQITAN